MVDDDEKIMKLSHVIAKTIYDDENTSSTEETKEELELKEKGFKEIDLNA